MGLWNIGVSRIADNGLPRLTEIIPTLHRSGTPIPYKRFLARHLFLSVCSRRELRILGKKQDFEPQER
jgi:hypothetical protein